MDPKPNTKRSRGEKKSKGERRQGGEHRESSGGGSHHAQSEHKERVVRETVSFTRPEAPKIVKPVPSYTPAPVATRKETKTDPDDDDDDGYGDDFEDYDDDFDFEDDDEDSKGAPVPSRGVPSSSVPKLAFSNPKEDSEMKQIRKSMEMENCNAITRQHNRTPTTHTPVNATPSPTLPDTKPMFSRVSSREEKNAGFNSNKVSQPRKQHAGLMGFASKQTIAFAPRIKRLEALKASGVLNMSDDKSLQLSIVPSTPFEFYHRQLYSTAPNIHQIGVPVEISRRDIDVNTDEITTSNKEVQYVYGDDTSLLNAIAKVVERKKHKHSGESKIDEDYGDNENASESTRNNNALATENNDDEKPEQNSNRLNLFLQASSQLCEDLLQEQSNANLANRSESRAHSSNAKSLFSSEVKSGGSSEEEKEGDDDRKWVLFGGDQSEGSNELVRLRAVSSVCFSPLQAHLLLSSHPYKEDDEEDLRPYRGIYCVWSTTMPGAPSVVLEASGQPTCCSFSGSQTFIVVGGTAEGTLHLWDLRESNSLHANRDTIDLRIAKGLRKPCYSTHSSLSSSTSNHAAPITQIESLASGSNDSAAASVSQFISMDASGRAIIWVTAQATSDTVVSSEGVGKELDFGLSPWGKVRLLQQRSLSSHVPVAPTIGHGNMRNATINLFDDSACPSAQTCMAIIPGNSSAFLFSADSGAMKRVVRYGTNNGAKNKARDRWCGDFSRLEGDVVEISRREESKGEVEEASYQRASSYQPAITCISVNNSPVFDSFMAKTGDSIAPLVLVGRSDGSVDLFRLDSQEPIQSWELSLYSKRPNGGVGSGHSVVYVQWATWGDVGAFVAADAAGNVYYFDILKQANKPIFVDSVNASLTPSSVQLSSCRSKGMSVYLAVARSNTTVSEGALKMRKIDENVSAGSHLTNTHKDVECKDNEDEIDGSGSLGMVPPQWASWVGRTTIEVSPWHAA